MSTSLFPVDRRQALVALSAMAVGGSALAQSRPAESFPTKPIQLVLPCPPGGSMDPIFRTLADAASKELGQPVVLMHKPGAGGVMGTAALASMPESDGYTVAVMHNSVIRAPLVQKVNFAQRLHLPDWLVQSDHRHLRGRRCAMADAGRLAGRRQEAPRRDQLGHGGGHQHQPHRGRAIGQNGGNLVQHGAF